MQDKQYITIREFAKLAGISVQAVYKRVEKDFKPYFKLVESKKMLDICALALCDIKPGLNHGLNQFKPVESKETQEISALEPYGIKPGFKPGLNHGLNPVEKETLDMLNQSLKTLTEQMAVKDRQLEEKDRQYAQEMAVKNTQIAELNERLREAMEINKANHVLLAVEQKKFGFFKRLFARKE
jgi:DNA-binding transcriptional MerR regulator